jgi:hypothetical protein
MVLDAHKIIKSIYFRCKAYLQARWVGKSHPAPLQVIRYPDVSWVRDVCLQVSKTSEVEETLDLDPCSRLSSLCHVHLDAVRVSEMTPSEVVPRFSLSGETVYPVENASVVHQVCKNKVIKHLR